MDSLNYRRVARHLNISHQTVYDWVRQSAEKLPPPPQPDLVTTAELDEVFSFVGNKIYILTIVDRDTRCFLGCKIVWTRTHEVLQHLVDFAPKAEQYYSDAFDGYTWLWYHSGQYEISEGKRDTFSVEEDNSELRHYLARLARSSRCFSRCPYVLICALRRFIFAFNSRQLYKQKHPAYPAHVKDFLTHHI